MQVKSLDGILPVPAHTRHHYHIRKFFKGLPSRGFITPTLATLFVYDHKDPCKSMVCIEALDGSVPGRSATWEQMLDINSQFWADVVAELEAEPCKK